MNPTDRPANVASGRPASPITLADTVVAAAQEVDGVVGFDGGPLGAIATYGGGRRVGGVSVVRSGGSVRITVRLIATYGAPLPELASAVRGRVVAALERAGVAGDLAVDVEITDIGSAEPSVG